MARKNTAHMPVLDRFGRDAVSNCITRDTMSRLLQSQMRLSFDDVMEVINRFIENTKLNQQGFSPHVNKVKDTQNIVDVLNSIGKSAALIHHSIDDFNDTYNPEHLLKQLQVIVLGQFRAPNPDPNDNQGTKALIRDILQPVIHTNQNSSSIIPAQKKHLSLFPNLAMRELYDASTEHGALDKERLTELVIRFQAYYYGAVLNS